MTGPRWIVALGLALTGVIPTCVAAGLPGAINGASQNVPPAMSQQVPAVPDTVEIMVAAPDSLPQPVAVHVVQDTLEFGGMLDLVVDYGPEQVDGPQLQLQAEGDWLVPVAVPDPGWWARLRGRSKTPAVDFSSLPPAEGLRVVRSFRVYRRDPLRIAWRDELSHVLTVVGQAAGADSMAGIRSPRPLRWTPWRLILLVVVLLAVATLVRWLWLRRHAPAPLADWPVPAPAWLALAVELQGLLAGGALARGESRLFLDQLASAARSYVAVRYRIAAREMTGQEIVKACVKLGHEVAHPAGFGRLIDLADRQRYNPEVPEPAFCREQAVQLLGRVARVRLETKYTAIAPEELLAAQKAWAVLIAELGLGAGRAIQPNGREVR